MENIAEKPHTRRRRRIHAGGMLSIDVHAQRSRLNSVNPALKLGFALAVLCLCVAADSALVGVVVAASMLGAIVVFGGTPAGYALSLMKLPVIFIVISCAAIACNISAQPLGYLDIALFGGFISVTPVSLAQAGLLFFRAYGAVTCLYFLSLSTPMQEIIEVLRCFHLPEIVIELMYLIYRYIFLLLDMQSKMTVAASSRLGYSGYANAWYTFSHISGNLLAASFRRSGICFDAMESRCYQGKLAFLTKTAPVRARHVVTFSVCFLLLLGLTWLLKSKGVDLF